MDNSILKEIINDPVKYANNVNINDLEDNLKKLAELYTAGNPVVSDDIYDTMIEILKIRCPKSKFLKKVGAIVEGNPKSFIDLPYEMGSLNKIKPGKEELDKWKKKYKGPYNLSDKLDGISAQIYKNNDGKISMFSRGDGKQGQDISNLLNFVIKNKDILKNIEKNTSIRGELVISKKDFVKISKSKKNARNAVAGLVNSKHPDSQVGNITNFVAYSVLFPRMTHENQIKTMKNIGFDVVENLTCNNKDLTEKKLEDYFSIRRTSSEYEIDGIVCFDDSKIYEHKGGYPDYAFAFKMLLTDQVAETSVVDVIWTPSKDGYLKPRVQIKPVELLGTSVSFATGFNAKYIVDNSIGIGSIIKICRSGDVIPYILEIIKKSPEPKYPDFPYKWNDTGVELILDSTDNEGDGEKIVIIKKLTHFFSTIGVKYLSEGIIKKLVLNDFNSVKKILKAKKKDLYIIEGLGEKIIDKIYVEIDRAFAEIKLETLMGASNELGRGLNEKKLAEIINTFPNILKENENNVEDLAKKITTVQGFSEKLSLQFAQNFKNFKKFYYNIAKIKDLSRFENIVNNVDKNGVFSDKSIVFTGFRDKNLEKFIVENGGKVSNSVSGNTFIVVYGDENEGNSKMTKAKEKNITLMSKTEFVKKYM